MSLLTQAANGGARWSEDRELVIRATFGTSDAREAAARALAGVAGAEVTTAARYEATDALVAPTARRWRWAARAGARAVAAYRPRRQDPLSAPLLAVPLGLAILAGWLIAFALFRNAGPQGDLPGVALGSKLLLDVVRATVVVGLLGAALALIVRSVFGQFPSEFSAQGVKWTQIEVEQRSSRQEQLTALGGLVATLDDRLRELERHRNETS